jgi:hypothetical protein
MLTTHKSGYGIKTFSPWKERIISDWSSSAPQSHKKETNVGVIFPASVQKSVTHTW